MFYKVGPTNEEQPVENERIYRDKQKNQGLRQGIRSLVVLCLERGEVGLIRLEVTFDLPTGEGRIVVVLTELNGKRRREGVRAKEGNGKVVNNVDGDEKRKRFRIPHSATTQLLYAEEARLGEEVTGGTGSPLNQNALENR